MSENGNEAAPVAVAPEAHTEATREANSAADGTRPSYWIRVHGYPPIPIHNYPEEIGSELVYYPDCFDARTGPLRADLRELIHEGDVFIYYADGGAILYGLGTVSGPVEGPFTDARKHPIWRIPVKREATIKVVNKAPHAVPLTPPSGWHFLHAARAYTFVRVPAEDGEFYAAQIRARASSRD